MSKIRETIVNFDADLPAPTPDHRQWVVYTCKRAGAPYKWAGYLEAPDIELALQYSREHYGLDEACIGIICHDHTDGTDGPYGLEPLLPGEAHGEDGDCWTVFTLVHRGGNHQTAGNVKAPDAKTALQRATAVFADGKIRSIRVVKSDRIFMTNDDESPIWPNHDMTYKLAKGYSKDVRAKWARFRDERTYEQYRKEDIAKHF